MNGDLPKNDASPLRGDRLVSLDALRGFDMLWIIGGVPILNEAAKLSGWAPLNWLAGQMHHTDWDGFTFYDLIFPLFLFIAGVAMPFSFEKRLERGDSKVSLFQHVIMRGLLLVLFGMIYNGILKFDWTHTRFASVLGRIGLAYLFAGIIVLSAGVRGQIAWMVALLGAYWAAMKFIPVPGFGAGDLAPGHNLADYIDSRWLPGMLLHNNPSRDPEGLLSTVPAIGTALAGALTGQLLKSKRYDGYSKTVAMIVAGVSCLGLALLWNRDFPINKNLWSSSFVLYCAGWSLLFLAFFYLVTDVWRFRAWTLPLVVIGSNSILIYMAQKFIKFEYTSEFFFGGLLKFTADSSYMAAYQPLLLAISILTIKWLMLYVLYRKRVFLRI
jgi:predicted acyltransferase